MSGSVDTKDTSTLFSFSFQVPYLGDWFYLNLQAQLNASNEGIIWSKGKISSHELSDQKTNLVFTKVVQILLGKQYGANILSGIKQVDIQDQTIRIEFVPPSNLQKGFAKAARRVSRYSGQSLNFSTDRVQHYLDFLVNLTRALPKGNISASKYLKVLLVETQSQTELHGFPAADENLSAIFALAVQVAPGIFRHFIDELKVNRLNATRQPLLTISNRQDLAKHFIISAALHILSEKGLSFSIGEAKEILDLGSGGSGFSFADIAADLSGIRFAELAIENNESARYLQDFSATSIHEADFFPSIAELPEGLDEANFQATYKDVNSEQYTALIMEIQYRIGELALYSEGQ